MAEKKNVHQRLAQAMGVVKYIQSERKPNMQYNTVSHDSVTAKVRPALLDAGIVYYPVRCESSQNGNRAQCEMTVRFVNIDQPDDFFDVQTFGYGVDTQDKGPGKAMSYAVKYALLKALGLETGEDADNENVPHEQKDPAVTIPQAVLDAAMGAETLESLATVWTANKQWQTDPEFQTAKETRKQELQKKEAA